VVLVGGVGAYVLLPSATIVVTPRLEDISMPAETVTADPAATEPDSAARVIPAVRVENDLTVSDTFPATGNASRRPPPGRRPLLEPRLRTSRGRRHRQHQRRRPPDQRVTVPRPDLVGLTVFPDASTP
jgi:hypothetical protein